MKSRLAVLSCLSLVLIGSLTLLVAGGVPVQVRFLAQDGSVVVGSDVALVNSSGQTLIKLPATEGPGIYTLKAEPGNKLQFEVDSPSLGRVRVEAMIPANLVGPLDIPLAPSGPEQTPPANDLCADSIAVAVPSDTSGTTIDATIDYPEVPDCGPWITAPGVWYTMIGTGTPVTVSVCDAADYDTKISVYCKGCEEALCVGGNDDGTGCSGYTSELTVATQAGFEYLILVHGYGSGTGDFNLTVREGGTPGFDPVDCAPPVPVGACCNCDAPPFNCDEQTEEACMARGAVWQGPDTLCVQPDGTPTSYGSSPNAPIDSLLPPVVDTVTVPTSFPTGDVNVELQIEHTYIGDLEITIEHNGVSQTIWDGRCTSTDNIMATADDEGTETLCATISAGPSNSVFFSSEVAGLGPLSVFDGKDASGDWTLTVDDTFIGDVGVLITWALHVDSGTYSCPDQNGRNCWLCKQKVAVCHVPSGNPDNAHTIWIAPSAVPAHLAHGDSLGTCEEGPDTDRRRKSRGPKGAR